MGQALGRVNWQGGEHKGSGGSLLPLWAIDNKMVETRGQWWECEEETCTEEGNVTGQR